jgi:hypothetical protein
MGFGAKQLWAASLPAGTTGPALLRDVLDSAAAAKFNVMRILGEFFFGKWWGRRERERGRERNAALDADEEKKNKKPKQRTASTRRAT